MKILLKYHCTLFLLLALWAGIGMPESNEQEQADLKQGTNKTVKQLEYKYKLRPESWKKDVKTCNADLSISYLQYDTQAKVETIIEHNDCAASGGEYTLHLWVNDARGETQEIEYGETWSRDDNTPYESQKVYEIGKNVELFRVRTQGLTCICAPEQKSE
jgi:hypothetical protein